MQRSVADERGQVKEKRKWMKPSLPPRPEPPKIPRAASVITVDPRAKLAEAGPLPKTTPLPPRLVDRIGMPTIAVGFDIAPWPRVLLLALSVCGGEGGSGLRPRARKHTAGQSKLPRKATLGSLVGTL